MTHRNSSYDESLGIATSSSPFGPWTKFEGNPIINGSSPQVKGLLWCDQGGPGPNPGVLHVDEASDNSVPPPSTSGVLLGGVG